MGQNPVKYGIENNPIKSKQKLQRCVSMVIGRVILILVNIGEVKKRRDQLLSGCFPMDALEWNEYISLLYDSMRLIKL